MSSPAKSLQSYSIGPTEIGCRLTGVELKNSSPQELESKDGVQVSDSSSGQDDSETKLVPKGCNYPPNSKRVKAVHLQQTAATLGLLTREMAATTRQLIEGKLLEMDWEPENAQVITQATSEKSVIFLVDQSSVMYNSHEHITHVNQPVNAEGDDCPGESSSALHNKDSKLAVLQEALEAQNRELLEACEALHQVQETLQNEQQSRHQVEIKLGESEAVLEKDKRKVKKIWWKNL